MTTPPPEFHAAFMLVFFGILAFMIYKLGFFRGAALFVIGIMSLKVLVDLGAH